MFQLKTILVAGAVALAPVVSSAASITIDSFDTPQIAISPSGAGIGASSTIAAPEAIGGSRTITADGDGAFFPILTTAINVAGGTASISNSDQVVGSGLFAWDAGGTDLTAGGVNDTFVLVINSVDLGVTFDLTVDGVTSTSAFSAATGDVLFDFAAFGDLTSANDISLLVSGPAAFDASFSFFGAEDLIDNPVAPIPLPAGSVLLGSLLLGAGIFARRRKT